MRTANVGGRLKILVGDRAVDVEQASGARFGPDPQGVFDDWDGFRAWANEVEGGESFDPKDLGAPVPAPRQIFAIGLNYVEHAAEAGYPPDTMPVTFTKFPSCLTGPYATVELSGDKVDWEVELVVVIGRRAEWVARADAWSHVAGLTIGQDLSERAIQMEGVPPQFSLGKSFAGFGPTGPWLATPDELSDPDDLQVCTVVSGEVMQESRTSKMIYDVSELIARLSSVCALLPGDLIFTGTPAGVGNRQQPPRYLGEDDVLVSRIEGLGEMRTTFAWPTRGEGAS